MGAIFSRDSGNPSGFLQLCAPKALNQTVKHGSSTVTALLPALVWMADLIKAQDVMFQLMS